MSGWISNMITSAVAAPVANAVASAGGMAGGAIGAVGNGINGVGQSIETSIRYYGDGVKNYGNAVKDWTKADGPRESTATNPLGLSSSATGGKLAFTGGGGERSKELKAKYPSAPTRKALPASPATPKSASKAAPRAAAKPASKASAPARGKAPITNGTKAASAGTKRVGISAESRPDSKKPVARAARPGGAPKKDYGPGSRQAANPLGL